MSVAIATPDDNNLSAFEQFVHAQEPAKALFLAIGSYLDCPAIVSESAFKVLMHLLNIVDYDDFSKPVIISIPTLMENTGMAKETVQRAVKELMAKKLIAYTSGHYEKDKAYEQRKEKFRDTQPTRSYNEPNVYVLEEAVKVGLYMAWLKSLAREQGIPAKEVREIIRATSKLQDLFIHAVLGRPPVKMSMKELRGKLHELPEFLYVLIASDEIGQKLGNLPDEIGQKLGNLIGQKLANLIGQKLANLISYSLGKAPLPFSRPLKSPSLKNTHTQHPPAEKNPDTPHSPSSPAPAPRSKQPPEQPPAQKLPQVVYEALIGWLHRQEEVRNPIALLRKATEQEIEAMARQVILERVSGDYWLEEEVMELRSKGVKWVDALYYVLSAEREAWLSERGLVLEARRRKEENIRVWLTSKPHLEAIRYFWEAKGLYKRIKAYMAERGIVIRKRNGDKRVILYKKEDEKFVEAVLHRKVKEVREILGEMGEG